MINNYFCNLTGHTKNYRHINFVNYFSTLIKHCFCIFAGSFNNSDLCKMKKQVLFILLLFWVQSVFSQCDPTNLTTSNITGTEVTFSWQSTSATYYSVKWKISGSTSSWNTNDPNVNQTPSLISANTLYLDSLLPNTIYEWRVRSFGCSPNNWVNGSSFTTLFACNLSSLAVITNATCNNSLDG